MAIDEPGKLAMPKRSEGGYALFMRSDGRAIRPYLEDSPVVRSGVMG
jgi:hypothetical protein